MSYLETPTAMNIIEKVKNNLKLLENHSAMNKSFIFYNLTIKFSDNMF